MAHGALLTVPGLVAIMPSLGSSLSYIGMWANCLMPCPTPRLQTMFASILLMISTHSC